MFDVEIYGREFTVLWLLFLAVGIVSAVDALFQTRSSQGAIAWFLSLILFPYVAVPVYLVFSRPRLRGYRKLVRKMSATFRKQEAKNQTENPVSAHFGEGDVIAQQPFYKVLENIAGSKFSPGNVVELLIDGKAFFPSLIGDIRKAKQEINLCFYMIRDDSVGIEVKQELLQAVKRGITVRFLYDKVGSLLIGRKFVRELKAGGIKFEDFHSRRGWWNFFEINARNHRKIAVFDHEIAYVGGCNIGDEYLGKSEMGHWRDTNVRIQGPEVGQIEKIFFTDWAWATQEPVTHPPTTSPVNADGDMVLTLATGCTDQYEECLQFFLSLINNAEKRLWIATPYFIPDDALLHAINLAAVRGADVRLIVPKSCDNVLAGWAGLFYFPLIARHGVRIYRYSDGTLHQKVMLVDDTISVVGSANLDNRSIKLSFEIMVAIAGSRFAKQMEQMLEADFKRSTILKDPSLERLPVWKRIGAHVTRLLSPIL